MVWQRRNIIKTALHIAKSEWWFVRTPCFCCLQNDWKKIPTQLACVARETPRKRALMHGEAAKPAEKKKTTLTPPHSPCVLANGLCARQTIPPATQVTTQKVRKLKGSQSLYQTSPSEDKEYCLNDISAIKSRLHHISLFNSSIINFFHKTGQDFFSYLLVQC